MSRARPIRDAVAAACLGAAVSAATAACAGFYYASPESGALAASSAIQATRWAGTALTAAEAAELAAANSAELEAERKALELRDAAWALGFRSYLPSLELSAASDERLSTSSSDAFSKTLSARLNQPLWDGGRLATARALEAAESAAARAELGRKLRDTGEAAVSAYRSVVAARAKLRIQRESLASAESERAILEEEARLGLARASELSEADLAMAGMEIELAEAELAVSASEAELADALGVPELPLLTDDLDPGRTAIEIGEEAFVAAAVRRSLDLELARNGLARKRAEAKVAAFAWLPTLGLELGCQIGGGDLPLTEASWSAALTIDFDAPLASGGAGVSGGGDPPDGFTARTQAALRALLDPAAGLTAKSAALASTLAERNYLRAEARVALAAKSALGAYRSAARKLELAKESLALTERRLELATLRASLGQDLRSKVVEAELLRAAEEAELVDAASALVAAERELERLLDLPPDTLAAFWERCQDRGPPDSREEAP